MKGGSEMWASFLSSLRSSKLLCSIRGILWSSRDKSLIVFLGVWMYLFEAGKMLSYFCWGVPVLFPVETKKENRSVKLCFVPYFCLLIIHLYNCGSSAPGIRTYLSPSSQKPLLDEAGKVDWKNSLWTRTSPRNYCTYMKTGLHQILIFLCHE